MALKLFNTMGRQLQEFVPINKGFVGFYGCGPTVYNYAHIGNLRAYVFLDILDRALCFLGYQKKHVMNITDIGHLTGDADTGADKMLLTAQQKHQSVLEVADFYTKAFFCDINRLNIKTPDVVCRATEHIPQMIDLIKRIQANGHTYTSGGNLYYDVTTFPDYGKLAGLSSEVINATNTVSRVGIDKNKKHPCDFVLWFTKSKFENQALSWESPWGQGYPGWHIECSSMSMEYLGEHFDIHTGGIDHIPIHHTNEIAQSQGATGKKWVNYWLHNEFLVIAKDKDKKGHDTQTKMSKSGGNFLTLQSLIDSGFAALDYRFFLLGAHYRTQIAFSTEAMQGAKSARDALLKRVFNIANAAKWQTQDIKSQEAKTLLNDFSAAIQDDLSTPRALSVLQTATKKDDIAPCELLELIYKMDSVLGLDIENSLKALKQKEMSPCIALDDNIKKQIEGLIAKRLVAKKQKDFVLADKIRADLLKQGIKLTDTPQGTTWSKE